MAAHKLSIYQGSVRRGKFELLYQASPSPCYVWWPTGSESVLTTFLKSPSGSGKSTLLGALYNRLMGVDCEEEQFTLDFAPDIADLSALSSCYVPQHPPMVNHWKAQEILPANPLFLGCFFPETRSQEVLSKYLGSFSVGQKRKLYVCSALEKLAVTNRKSSFLLLDEALDGQGAPEAARCLGSVVAKWKEVAPDRALHILLVTHLNENELQKAGPAATLLQLAVQNSTSSTLTVQMENL